MAEAGRDSSAFLSRLRNCLTLKGYPEKAKGYQCKDVIQIFYLIRRSTLCDHWFGHREAHKTGPLLYKNFLLQNVVVSIFIKKRGINILLPLIELRTVG